MPTDGTQTETTMQGVEPDTASNETVQLTVIAEKIHDIKAKIEEVEASLDELKGTKAELEKEISSIMEAMNLKTIKDDKGRSLTLTEPIIVARFLEGQKDTAIAWLKENGHGYVVAEQVNYHNLNRVVKEMLEAGANIPEDKIGYESIRKIQTRRS